MQLIFFILFTYIIKVLSAQLLRSVQKFLAVLGQINSINKKTQQWLSLPSLPLPLKSKLVVITFFSENTDHSLAKIMPALQATEKLVRHKH